MLVKRKHYLYKDIKKITNYLTTLEWRHKCLPFYAKLLKMELNNSTRGNCITHKNIRLGMLKRKWKNLLTLRSLLFPENKQRSPKVWKSSGSHKRGYRIKLKIQKLHSVLFCAILSGKIKILYLHQQRSFHRWKGFSNQFCFH